MRGRVLTDAERAAKAEATLRQVFGILVEIYSELEDNFDVVDADYGQVAPNSHMRIGIHLAHEMGLLGYDVTAYRG